MMFWLKNIVFALLLIGLAYYLIANQEALFSQNDEQEITSNDNAITEKPKVSKKETNPAAEGLSRFYANLRGSEDEDQPRVRNNIVYLPAHKGDIVDILEAKRLVTRPLRKNWKSTKLNRPFRPEHTLHQKLSEYAKEEGLEVIWWLDKDFIIKDPFRIDKDIVDTAYQVGLAINGHFQDGLSTYFCYQHRTLVLIEKHKSYLDEECVKLPRKSRTRSY
ncbi:TcpQ domain-containing protein [Thalassotalea hakodatensis]|uniref:TcpQ domain-containing protein n=1 Tax=Thalassotalea hakodatensis TaxID=3030492 RepID=UPI0025746639|nr:TcpQ domain-containing protein [Thalassotalea hakodatensis]